MSDFMFNMIITIVLILTFLLAVISIADFNRISNATTPEEIETICKDYRGLPLKDVPMRCTSFQ